MRKIVSNQYKKIFEDLFFCCNTSEEVEKELGDFYSYLCNFTHPSIVKTYIFKIQNDKDNLDCIRTIFKLNINFCKILMLLSFNFLTSKDDMSEIYDLYAIIFLCDVNLITDVDNLKSLLKRYDEYLYLNITRKYFKSNSKKIKQIQKEIDEINKSNNLGEVLAGVMKDTIIKFGAIDIFNKYFN